MWLKLTLTETSFCSVEEHHKSTFPVILTLFAPGRAASTLMKQQFLKTPNHYSLTRAEYLCQLLCNINHLALLCRLVIIVWLLF